ncbi:hypothetical protein FGG08_000548 [Glutinoglossum americanum]|uniref:Uncharacterized protein n=1 Tax=Glutinoglossum americanum TaxID=1670608 RepID=A0A9P8IGB9_9PEZI|nr:hypothetical protein FGG08_000548 [Glutinoglossum americanum]
MTTYRAFQSIFGEVDERNVREYVKQYVKGRGSWYAEGKRAKNWKMEVEMLGDELAAKYWPDLESKDLYYTLEQYLILIRLHANKYDMRKRVPSDSSSAHGPVKDGGDDSELIGSASGFRDTLGLDKSTRLPGTPTPGPANAATPKGRGFGELMERMAAAAEERMKDEFVERLAARVEERLKDGINTAIQRESERVEDLIQDLRYDVQNLREGLREHIAEE